jgi:rhodanese-related sulfurtransferase
MGPLVPDIIGNNLNFIVALVIGVFFGAILEQAGFSTSKKLVGLFYGYDFTVLRVFFTAGIVAMIGIMALAHFGLIDMNLVYINPLFLWSAIVGGIIMGLGFVVGGFCPGTSVCAAAIGKIDAMIFIGGAFIGVIIFAEGYPIFEPLYKAANYGSPQMFQTFHISETLFAFIVIIIALASFWLASMVENKVNGVKKPPIRLTPYYAALTLIGIILAVSAFAFPDRETSMLQLIQDNNYVESYKLETMTTDEFAYRIMDEQDNKIQIFDFRPIKEYEKMSIPKSISFTFENLFEKEPSQVLKLKHKVNVFVADNELTERKMAIVAEKLGFKRIEILQGGLDAFKNQILDFKPIKDPKTLDEVYQNRFRAKAQKEIPILIENNKPKGAVVKVQKRVVGGC